MDPIIACHQRESLDGDTSGIDRRIHEMFTVAASVHAEAVAANNSRLALLDVQECDRLLDLWLSRHPDRVGEAAEVAPEPAECAAHFQTPS